MLSTIIYLLIFGVFFYAPLEKTLIQIEFMNSRVFDFIGMGLLLLALYIGLAALYEMKNSWRVGIRYDQKTDLVTKGIYSFSRNPYFLSYDLLFTGILFIFPTLVFLALTLGLMIVFHLMILEEERYLTKVQGKLYQNYRSKTGRYLFGI